MEALKRMWSRILVAFAQPASGHGASGTRGADPQSDEHLHAAEDPKGDAHTWKSHGGNRH